ncbi:MAG: cytochrome ubiquinol oxidase subunit I [Campylobacteraceae bacterium]|nr:cytochrome ubiquinol oxidase subunit I [Campylobacteraceae bacterium]
METLIDWSRAQFALTAMYHFLFVPLTLGLSFIVAFMESLYVKTGDEKYKTMTKFWMTLFGINFAIGVATGLIMEFEFGTNWAAYSWIVGDIFGAPLAIEGILAFFLEATFFAVMFFGWDRVSKRFHLLSTWLVAIGSNLSALWILVANGWMQYPVGMSFNLDTARNEMVNFWDVILSPVAVSKFLHTVSGGYITSSLFVLGVSAWFLLKGKELWMAKKSVIIASIFGLLASLFVIATGDEAAYQVAGKQPMKLAAMEGLYHGEEGAGIVMVGALNPNKKADNDKEPYLFEVTAPKMLSLLGYHDMNAFVPGIKELIYGDEARGIESAAAKIERGKKAKEALVLYKKAKAQKDEVAAAEALKTFRMYEKELGYGYLQKPEDLIPPVGLVFYSFHLMVGLGVWFLALFAMALLFGMKDSLEKRRVFLKAALWSIPLGYLASEAGWIVAEVGRQPWAIEGLLPVGVAVSNVDTGMVQATFWLFFVLFTALLIAEVRIMLAQISLKAKGESHV